VQPRPRLAVPELFLGLLAIGVAVVVTARIFSDTVKEVRHTRDTITVSGSARKPISANLVRWDVYIRGEAPQRTVAAKRLRVDSATVRSFLIREGIPSDAISSSVVSSEVVVERISKRRRRITYRVSQGLEVSTREIDVVARAATRIGVLIEQGIDVSPEPLAYISTELSQAKLDALEAATAEARRRAEILLHGLGGKLGPMRSTSQGVYQITPRDSNEVSDYGINDTSSREKDVNAVVSATFAVER
jgi:hypothetical protein